MTLHSANHIHFIGAGGVGVSAIAKWALEHGKVVTGSDLQHSVLVDWLQRHGAQIAIGPHSAQNLPEHCDLVVHTVAVGMMNPEYVAAQTRNLTLQSYPAAVQELLAGAEGIAIAGTHGKSTTTALLAQILVEAKLDPTVIVGTRVPLFDNTNERSGKSSIVLVEADEYNQGILLYAPKHAVVLNVDQEHVEVYPTLADSVKAFQTFVGHTAPHGSVTLNADDPSVQLLKKAAAAPVRTFGLQAADLTAKDIRPSATGTTFTVSGLYQGTCTTKLFGIHNVRNALAAICVSHALGVSFSVVQHALSTFTGTWRRFELRGTWKQATLVDDYAHHPTEVAATIAAARQAFTDRRLICVFQPHLQTRTQAFLQEFAKVLQGADRCLILEVYDAAGRDRGTQISGLALAEAIGERARFTPTVQSAVQWLSTRVQPNDVILTLGAGDITSFSALAKE